MILQILRTSKEFDPTETMDRLMTRAEVKGRRD